MALLNSPPFILSDKIIEEINSSLLESFPWLDKAFGRAERIIKRFNGRDLKLPALFVGTPSRPNDYLELSPDSKIGNFSFWWLMDPESYEWKTRIPGVFHTPFALIFWFDLSKIFESSDARNLSLLESQIIKHLNRELFLKSGSIIINEIYRLPENIYREFDLHAVDNQFLMHPYGGFRLEGEFTFDEPC